ncbi:NAD(P)-binding protein [Infundibulicybe gibba]|nr:NAD(P)-binding protein [Infundibulicybe gibba]
MDLGLKDVHVLVTGASGGIGLDTTRLFIEQGARVTAHYNTNDATLQPLTKAFGPASLRLAQADLSLEGDVVKLFSDATLSFGPFGVIVVNHGIWLTADEPLPRMSLDRWKFTLDVNLTSTFLVAREYMRGLETASEDIKSKAAIILIGSTAGKYGEANHADYAASKSAMMYGLNLSLKNEIVKIAPKGRVNCVAPGWTYINIRWRRSIENPATVYRALATTPLKKFAGPRDIANQIVLLASTKVSGHVTGQVVMVEGGMEGRLLNFPEDL